MISVVMALINSVSWLDLAGEQEFCLQYFNRTSRVIQEMTSPEYQYPSLIFFLGRKSKDVACREIFPHNNFRRGPSKGFINLRLDSTTISSDLPLLFADSDPWAAIPRRIGISTTQEALTLPIAWNPPPKQSIKDLIYARLIFLFSDVVCIFADDLGGLEAVARYLTTWIKIRSSSSLSQKIRPRIIIVLNEDTVVATQNVLELGELRFCLQQEDQVRRDDAFSSITLLRLGGAQLSALARHRRLKEVLSKEVDLARANRIEERVLFSATHFDAFFRQAVTHTSQSITEPFNFISRSRIGNEIQPDYQTHLSTFLELGRNCRLKNDEITLFIASSILMDSYPPRMHSKFIKTGCCFDFLTEIIRIQS